MSHALGHLLHLAVEIESFQYLGGIISRTRGTDEDVKACIGKPKQVFAMLRPVWRMSSLSQKIKLRISLSNVKTVLTVWGRDLKGHQSHAKQAPSICEQAPEEYSWHQMAVED